MKIVIACFSGTGNTWWVAERIREEMAGLHQVILFSIEQASNADLEHIRTARLFVLGYPIYGSDMPEPVYRFVSSLLIPENPVDTAVFCTQVLFSGNGAFFHSMEMWKRGYPIRVAFHVNMPNNIPNLTSYSPEKIRRILTRAEKKIRLGVEAMEGKGRLLQGRSVWGKFLGLWQRPLYRKAFYRSPRPSILNIDWKTCTSCMLCVQFCPAGNIRMREKQLEIGHECIWCTRCVNYCPSQAVQFLGKSLKKSQYRGPAGFDPARIAGGRDPASFIDR